MLIEARALAERIERAEKRGLRSCVEAALRVAPHLHAQYIDVLGGIAPFVGAGSPLSEGVAIGIFERPTHEGVAALTQFYSERSTPARVMVSPLADVVLPQLLATKGYRPIEYQNVLACELARVQCRRDECVSEVAPERWALASATGFVEREPLPNETLVGLLIASSRGVTALAAYDNDRIVATGAMDLDDDLAGLFAASTLVDARRQGWQQRLILDRLARAREAGARYVRAAAAPASASERNFRRAGFEVLYTRAVWERPLEPTA